MLFRMSCQTSVSIWHLVSMCFLHGSIMSSDRRKEQIKPPQGGTVSSCGSGSGSGSGGGCVWVCVGCGVVWVWVGGVCWCVWVWVCVCVCVCVCVYVCV